MRNSVGGVEAERLSPARRRAVLVVVAIALMMVVSAVSGLNVALPDLARDIGATQTQMTWIVDAYTVVFAGLLLGAGALGDRHGRKLLLVVGLVVFGIAAGWAVVITDPDALIAARAVMGVGAAAVMPTTLSVITTSFPEEERGRAIGVWVGVAGGGAVLGLFASGILLEWFAWNSFFVLNIALAGIALVGTIVVVPTSREAPRPLDVVGAVLSLVAVAGSVFAIIEGADKGWGDGRTLIAATIGGLGIGGFVWRELRTRHPLLDVRLFTRRGFATGSLSIVAQFFASFGFFFIALQYLQFVVGRTPLESALTLLPLPFVLIPTARIAPRIADRVGSSRVSAIGLFLTAAGLAVLSGLHVDFEPVRFYVGLVLFALGMGLAGTPATTAITESLPASQQGVASAVNDVSREFGSALGIALLGGLLAASYKNAISSSVTGLPARVRDGAEASIAFVQSAAIDRLGPAAAPLVTAAKDAFVDGIAAALLTGAGIVACAAVLVLVLGARGARVSVPSPAAAAAAAAPDTPTEPETETTR